MRVTIEVEVESNDNAIAALAEAITRLAIGPIQNEEEIFAPPGRRNDNSVKTNTADQLERGGY